MTINPGIQRTVALLNAHGFRTTDSGDGETHDYECDRPEGYVCVVLDDPSALAAETDRLAALLVGYGVKVGPLTEEDDDATHVQASYDACDKVALIDVSPMHDRRLTLYGKTER
jgi:hypothetical protein